MYSLYDCLFPFFRLGVGSGFKKFKKFIQNNNKLIFSCLKAKTDV